MRFHSKIASIGHCVVSVSETVLDIFLDIYIQSHLGT